MKQIRAADWYDAGAPPKVKTSPHERGIFGLGR
jgi:peptide deformylase